MYVPPFAALLKNIGLTHQEFQNSQEVKIPATLLRFLLQVALADSEFDEQGYLDANPDVAAALRRGEITDVRLHYIGNGYFEGRNGGHPPVDEKWYLGTYSDVAAGMRARKVQSAAQHFEHVGAAECRAPSEAYVPDAVQWAKAVGKI